MRGPNGAPLPATAQRAGSWEASYLFAKVVTSTSRGACSLTYKVLARHRSVARVAKLEGRRLSMRLPLRRIGKCGMQRRFRASRIGFGRIACECECLAAAAAPVPRPLRARAAGFAH